MLIAQAQCCIHEFITLVAWLLSIGMLESCIINYANSLWVAWIGWEQQKQTLLLPHKTIPILAVKYTVSEDILLLWNRAPKTELRVSGLLNNQCRCTFVMVCSQNIVILWPEKWHRHFFTDSLTALIPLTPFSVAYFMGASYPVL